MAARIIRGRKRKTYRTASRDGLLCGRRFLEQESQRKLHFAFAAAGNAVSANRAGDRTKRSRSAEIARRLIERGVRFVQLFINSQIWDNHNELGKSLKDACDRTDLPIAGLLTDLKQRGLLDTTLVLWGGEMGRLPIAQLPGDKNAARAGRDHNKNAICTWMAGGGVKRGFSMGATDELGFAAVEDRVRVEDWHSTILHLLGLDHEHLFIERNGLKERLTGVTHPKVIEKVLA